MTMDFRAFVAEAPHLTMPHQRTLVYEGKLLFSNAAVKIPKAISQKWHDGFSFLNDENLDKCLSKKKIRLATPGLWLSSPHWAKCMTNCYPRRSPSKRHAKTTAIIRRRMVMWVYLDQGISQTVVSSIRVYCLFDRWVCLQCTERLKQNRYKSNAVLVSRHFDLYFIDRAYLLQTAACAWQCTVNPEYFVRTKFSYAGNLRPFPTHEISVHSCWPLRILWLASTFSRHFIFEGKPPCTKSTKIKCIRNILDTQ